MSEEEKLDPVEELIAECFDRPESEWDQAIDGLCQQRPELAESIRRRFALLRSIGFHAPHIEDQPDDGVFGDFKLLERLGRGGMGVVYRAHQTSLGRTVALKLIRNDYLEMPDARARFRREVDALSTLEHPAICTIYEAGEIDSRPYLAMRYLKGENLEQRIARQKLYLTESGDSSCVTERNAQFRVLAEFETISRALHTAHEAGLIHRDIKPANIMCTEDGEPVLLDFGLALPEEDLQGLTRSGDTLGTPAYMAPEQIDPRGHTLDRRCDVYSLASTLYECVTLEPPFRGSTREELYRAILTEGTPNARKTNSKLPQDLALVLEKAMQREPENRFANALDFAEELRRVQNFEPIKTRQASISIRLRRWAQREPIKAALVLVLALAVPVITALGGYLFAISDVIKSGEIAQQKRQLETELAYAYYYRNLKNSGEELKHFQAALTLDPSDRDALLGLRTARGEPLPPIADSSTDPADQFQLGLRSYDAARSKRSCERAFMHFQRAVLLAGSPRLFHMIEFGQSARGAGKFDEARACIETIQRHWPGEDLADREVARIAISLDPGLTIELTTHLLANKSPFTDLHTIRALAFAQTGQHAKAESDFLRGIELAPTNPVLFASYGNYLFRNQRYAEIIEIYGKAAEHESIDIETLGQLADALTQVGRPEDAKIYFDRILKQTPLTAIEHRHVGDAFQKQGKLDRAEAEYRKALALDSTIYSVYQRLARLHLARSDLPAFVKALEHLTEVPDPESQANAHFNLSRHSDRAGDYEAEEAHLRKALEHNPGHSQSYSNLAATLTRRERIPEALALYKKGQKLDTKSTIHAKDWAEWVEVTEAKIPDHERYASYAESKDIALRDEADRVLLAHYLLQHEHYLKAFSQFRTLMKAKGKSAKTYFDVQQAALAGLGLGMGLLGANSDLSAKELSIARGYGRGWLHRILGGYSQLLTSAKPDRQKRTRHDLRVMNHRPEIRACRDEARLSLLDAEERALMRTAIEEFDAILLR